MGKQRGRSGSWWGQAGFTLAEILMATAISSVVLLALYLLYDVNQVTFLRGEQQADLQQNARIAMDRIVRELRLAGSERQTTPVIPASCATAIQSTAATSISFIANIDADDATEKVQYTYDNVSNPPRINREQWTSAAGPGCNWVADGGAKSFAERVTALTFAYYDSAGNPTASLGNIRRISVTITTQDAQTGSKAQPFTLRAEVRPRNLGL